MLLETKGLKDFHLILKHSNSEKIMLLVQTCNNRFTNSKVPIYSFNNEEFKQVAKGKKLVEGLIVIKQIDLNILKQNFITNNNDNKLKEYKETIKELHEYKSNDENFIKKINTIEETIKEMIKNESKNEKTSKEILNNEKFEITLQSVDNDNDNSIRTIKEINFTEVSENLDISEPSGVVVYRYFGKWS